MPESLAKVSTLPVPGGIAAGAVWRPSAEVETGFDQCLQHSGLVSCMQDSGASQRAIQSAELMSAAMQSDVYIRSFDEWGKVDVAQVWYVDTMSPIRGTDVLVNGEPFYVHLGSYTRTMEKAMATVSGFNELSQPYPNISLWYPHVVSHNTLSDGSQQFVVAAMMLNGCRACDVLGTAKVAFHFDQHGRFRDVRGLGIELDR